MEDEILYCIMDDSDATVDLAVMTEEMKELDSKLEKDLMKRYSFLFD